MDEQNLKVVYKFEHLYLFRKTLGETITLKTIISRCIVNWKLVGK